MQSKRGTHRQALSRLTAFITYLIGIEIQKGKNVVIHLVPNGYVQFAMGWHFHHVEEYTGFLDTVLGEIRNHMKVMRCQESSTAFLNFQGLQCHQFKVLKHKQGHISNTMVGWTLSKVQIKGTSRQKLHLPSLFGCLFLWIPLFLCYSSGIQLDPLMVGGSQWSRHRPRPSWSALERDQLDLIPGISRERSHVL